MPHPDDQPGPLSVYRAFVVQFDTHTDVERGHLAAVERDELGEVVGVIGYRDGRVEHVVSGQAIQFHSLETLLAFMVQLLHTGHRHGGDGET